MLRSGSIQIAGWLLALLGLSLWAAAPAQTTVAPRAVPTRVFLPQVASHQPVVYISALYYDTQVSNEPDEAFQLWNMDAHPVQLLGYQVNDGSRNSVFPSLLLPAGTPKATAREASAFASSFGFAPDCEYGADSDPAVPNLAGQALRFANSGGQIQLQNPQGSPMDLLIYEAGVITAAGWQGPAVEPYTPSNSFPQEGQILYRKLRWSGPGQAQPLPDQDQRQDWAQEPTDAILGRRVLYPGWDLIAFGAPPMLAVTGKLTVALAPDNLFQLVTQTLASAQESILIEGYTFEHPALAELLALKASQGLSVTVLLEGTPVGGIEDQERYAAQLIEDGGGQVWFMVSDRNQASARYRYQHAKFAIIDRRVLLVSSENFGLESMPDDDKTDGTAGRRGMALATDAHALVDHALTLFQADFDPAHHRDLYRWNAADPKYGAPPPGFEPQRLSGGDIYQLVHDAPLQIHGHFSAQFVQAPEASLLPPEQGGLLGLVAQAGNGDTVLVEQLYERIHWGGSQDTPQSAPNPRLEAYLDAARRGAQVRILLDSFFDPRQNDETVTYLNRVALAESLDLQARIGNPTTGGLHNKMVLVQAGGQGWIHGGSLNGSEASAKVNRELALQVQSDAAYAYMATAFWHDWSAGSLSTR